MDEGYIKYRCHWVEKASATASDVAELICYRNALHQLNFIGEYANGIGFGNISQRASVPASASSPPFWITGTQTGKLPTLTAADYALVTAFDPLQNTLSCQGLRKASSESLTHGVIYANQPGVGAIIHVHSPALWQKLLHQVPTTRLEVPYGTPEMAAEVARLFGDTPLMQQRIFAMAGHEDGIVTFGDSLSAAYRVLINWCLMTAFVDQTAAAAALQLPYELGPATSSTA